MDTEDRRKADRRVSPAIGDVALQERGELLERITHLEAEIVKRDARIVELVGVLDHPRMQASIQAQEARTQKAIVAKIGVVDERAAFESACEAVNERGWSTSTDLAWKIWEIARRLNLCRLNLCHVSAGDDRGHDTRGSRKALGAVNAKLKAKVGRLERELVALKAQQSSSGAVDEWAAFKREERYMVVKLSRLADDQGDGLSREEQIYRIAHFGKAMVECVVVEHDWPEYEPTWSAIKARVTGEAAKPYRAQAVPDGWILVPVEPTVEMLDAGYSGTSKGMADRYKAMLAAAPSAKKESGDE